MAEDKEKSARRRLPSHVFEGRIVKTKTFINSCYGFEVSTSKLLFLMMSKLDPYDEQFREVFIPVVEIQAKMQLASTAIYTELDGMSDRMMALFIRVPTEGGGYKKLSVFNMFEYIPAAQSETGQAGIKFVFHQDIQPFLLKIDGRTNPFTELYLEYFRRCKKKYSYRLYELLKAHNDFRTRQFTLQDLREKLDIGTKYSGYGMFKQKVIVPTVEDLSSNTDIVVLMDEIKSNRKIVGVRFTWFESADFLKAVEEEGVIDVKPRISGFENKDAFVKVLFNRFEENYHMKFERAFNALPKKERDDLIEEFREMSVNNSSLKSALRSADGNMREALALNTTLMSVFRSKYKAKLLKSKEYDFIEYARACGHEVEQTNAGWRLTQPILYENM